MGEPHAVTDFVQGAMCEYALGRPVEVIIERNAHMTTGVKVV